MKSRFRARDAAQKDIRREFESRGHADWQWWIAALLAFAILDYLCFGMKMMK
jgi:hypothetical protein